MFAQFSTRLYTLVANQEYQISGDGTHWTAQKVEMTTLIILNVLDTTQIDWSALQHHDAQVRKNAEGLLDRVKQVANIYVLAGGEKPDFEGGAPYYGQPVYSVFWHVDLSTGEVSAPKGQPRKVFDLQSLIAQACNTSKAIAPIEHLRAKYRHPVITYILIGINALILGLMYLAGYPGDFLIPMRFGAIVPYLVHEHGEWFRLFTAMFVHFGVAHFAANAFGLIVFGSRMERYFGRSAFIAIYFLSGLLGSLASLFLSQAYAAGASGAIYGLVGALFAYTRITKRTIESLNWFFMFIYIGIGIAVGFSTTGIDNFAHLGGLLGGVILGVVYALKK
ncbi:MAG: rhomboid family intramembrane serine protease [Defluviitaleaceae bacterium]|nr:rhomboid family intramembrane serine protease [Defluviitaleaceae bacterium]